MKNNEREELWKEFPLGYKSKFRYAVSNFGRIKSFTNDIGQGRLLKCGLVNGYRIFMYKLVRDDKPYVKSLALHKLVATLFMPEKPVDKTFVVHLDYQRDNNHIDNLRWATKEEMIEHNQKSPAVIVAKKRLDDKNRKEGFVNLFFTAKRKKQTALTQFYPGEEWKQIALPDKLHFSYAISNFGRIMSFVEKFEDGRILKPNTVDGYKIFTYKVKTGNKISGRHLFIRKLVAQYFLPPPRPDQTFVLLLDRDRSNNCVENLRWGTKQEMVEHFKKSPHVIKARNDKKHRGFGQKLTATQVLLIKQKLFDPNRKTRLKIIAKQYGVSEMALHRIKTGENWAHIKVRMPKKDN